MRFSSKTSSSNSEVTSNLYSEQALPRAKEMFNPCVSECSREDCCNSFHITACRLAGVSSKHHIWHAIVLIHILFSIVDMMLASINFSLFWLWSLF